MSIIKRMRKQTAVWWQRSAEPDRFGRFSYSDPIEIKCRWDDIGLEYANEAGQVTVSRSTVYVDREIGIGDRLKKGPMESNVSSDPLEEEDTFQVERFDQIPNFRATEMLYIAYL